MRTAGSYVIFVVLGIGALLAIFPVYWIFATAIDPHASIDELIPPVWDFSSFTNTWSDFPFAQWFANSWLIAGVAVVITVSINLLAGYTFAKYSFPGRTVLFFAILVTLMVPIQVTIIPLYVMMRYLHLIDTQWALILPGLSIPL